jgi:hypothetical protein
VVPSFATQMSWNKSWRVNHIEKQQKMQEITGISMKMKNLVYFHQDGRELDGNTKS